MINAIEARHLSNANNHRDAMLKTIVDEMLNYLNKQIVSTTEQGFYGCRIDTDNLPNATNRFLFSKRDIVTAICEKLEEYGYTVSANKNFNAFHITWNI